MRPRSLLFASLMNGAPWGGSEELWYRTALRAAAQGHDVSSVVYAWPERCRRLEALRAAGVRVFELPNEGHRKRTPLDKLRLELWTKRRRRAALAAIPFESYDGVVLSQGGWQDLGASEWSAARARLRRYVVLFHNYDDALSIAPRRWARLAGWIEGASANLFAADPIRLGIERKFGLRAPSASVLLNPIAFAPPERTLPMPPGPPWRFAMLASLNVARKAQDVLLRAFARPEWRERSFQLSLHGDGPDEALLARQVAEAGLSAKVRLEGHTNDVLGAIGRAHVVLQLTRTDAMPISVMEAMAAGRPVAVTPVGDMPAWIHAGETGWVAAARTEEAIGATLEEVWACRDAWAAMGERAHRAYRERCPESAEERLLEIVLGAG